MSTFRNSIKSFHPKASNRYIEPTNEIAIDCCNIGSHVVFSKRT